MNNLFLLNVFNADELKPNFTLRKQALQVRALPTLVGQCSFRLF